MDRVPPQALQAEEVVLGAILLERSAIEEVANILTPESFYKPANQEVYRAIASLYAVGQPIDIITVTNELRKTGRLEKSGGAYYVTDLTSKVNSANTLEIHARIIAEMHIKRRVIQIATATYKAAYDETIDCFDLLNKCQTELIDLANSVDSSQESHVRSILKDVLTDVGLAMNKADGLTGVPSGFIDIDKVTGGWQNGDLIIIGARPAMGKTAFLVNALRNASVIFDLPVALFSMEMTKKQIGARLIAAEVDEIELSTDRLIRGKISDEEFKLIHKKISKLTSSNIFIDDSSGLSLAQVRAKITKLKSKHNIQLAAIDYLQLMSGVDKKGGNREQDISMISRGLKCIAKDLNIPIIALSQLSRAVEARTDKKPILSDLRESGAIEQDADVVAFLYRPEYYKITQDEVGNDLTGIGQFIVAKHRNGALEDVLMKFVSKRTKFYNMHEYPEVNSVHNYKLPYKDDTNEDRAF